MFSQTHLGVQTIPKWGGFRDPRHQGISTPAKKKKHALNLLHGALLMLLALSVSAGLSVSRFDCITVEHAGANFANSDSAHLIRVVTFDRFTIWLWHR